MAKPEFIYKVQRSDGLFSAGGSYDRYTKAGKVWKSLGHVITALKLKSSDWSRSPTDWLAQFRDDEVVIEYEIVERRRISVRDLMREYVPDRVLRYGK